MSVRTYSTLLKNTGNGVHSSVGGLVMVCKDWKAWTNIIKKGVLIHTKFLDWKRVKLLLLLFLLTHWSTSEGHCRVYGDKRHWSPSPTDAVVPSSTTWACCCTRQHNLGVLLCWVVQHRALQHRARATNEVWGKLQCHIALALCARPQLARLLGVEAMRSSITVIQPR